MRYTGVGLFSCHILSRALVGTCEGASASPTIMKNRKGLLARGTRASRVSKLEDRTGVLDARGRPSRLVLRIPSDIGRDEQRQAVGAHHHIPVTIHRFEML